MKNKFADISDEELEQIASQPEKDYHSPLSGRGPTDLIRDALHGFAKGILPEKLDPISNMMMQQHGDKYDVNETLNKIKPDTSSPTGDMLSRGAQFVGENIGPGMLAHRIPQVRGALTAIREGIPFLNRTGAAHERFFENVDEQGAQANMNPAILEAIERFHQGTPMEHAAAPNLQLARQGNIKAGHSLQSDLGKMGRSWLTEQGRQLPAQRLQQDAISDLLRAVEEENSPELRRQLENTQQEFKTRKQLTNVVKGITGGAVKTAAVVKAITRILGGH